MKLFITTIMLCACLVGCSTVSKEQKCDEAQRMVIQNETCLDKVRDSLQSLMGDMEQNSVPPKSVRATLNYIESYLSGKHCN